MKWVNLYKGLKTMLGTQQHSHTKCWLILQLSAQHSRELFQKSNERNVWFTLPITKSTEKSKASSKDTSANNPIHFYDNDPQPLVPLVIYDCYEFFNWFISIKMR